MNSERATAPGATHPDELFHLAQRFDTPRWLSDAAMALLARDPVKAANEAKYLATLLVERADRILSETAAAIEALKV